MFDLFGDTNKFITYLVESYSLFRESDYLFWLYCLVGPIMIAYTKPSMSANKRMFILLSAIFISIVLYTIWMMQIQAIKWYWYEYNKCSDMSEEAIITSSQCKATPSMIARIGENHQTIGTILSFLAMLTMSPFMGMPQLIWRIYHRHRIKAMGTAFKGKLFSNIMIFISLLWIFVIMIVVNIIVYTVYLMHIIASYM